MTKVLRVLRPMLGVASAMFSRVKVYIYAAIIASTFFAGWKASNWYWEGKHNALILKYQKAVVDSRDQVRQAEQERIARLDEIEAHNATKARLLDAEGVEIIKEVIRYVESPAVNNCNLDPEWVRIHNRAATGRNQPTDTASESNATTKQALAVVTANYNSCRRDILRFEGLQDWVNGLIQDVNE